MSEPLSPEELASDAIFLASYGLISSWICAPANLSRAEVEHKLNTEGLTSRHPDQNSLTQLAGSDSEFTWVVLEIPSEEADLESPGACGDTQGRRHWKIIMAELATLLDFVGQPVEQFMQ